MVSKSYRSGEADGRTLSCQTGPRSIRYVPARHAAEISHREATTILEDTSRANVLRLYQNAEDEIHSSMPLYKALETDSLRPKSANNLEVLCGACQAVAMNLRGNSFRLALRKSMEIPNLSSRSTVDDYQLLDHQDCGLSPATYILSPRIRRSTD